MDENYGITDLGTFITDFGDAIYDLWIYNKNFTGFEGSPVYLNNEPLKVLITNAVAVPGDVLIEFTVLNSEYDEEKRSYYRLSEVHFEKMFNKKEA